MARTEHSRIGKYSTKFGARRNTPQDPNEGPKGFLVCKKCPLESVALLPNPSSSPVPRARGVFHEMPCNNDLFRGNAIETGFYETKKLSITFMPMGSPTA